MRSIPATRQMMRERSAELLVTVGPDGLGARRREAPRLALSEETVRWSPDRHVGRVQVTAAPDVVAASVDAHGQVESEDLTAL